MLLAGVQIVVIDPADGSIVATTVSDEQGRFELSDLPPGTLTFTASLTGFLEVVQSAVTIEPGEAHEVNFDLAMSTLEEDVEVAAQGGTPLDILDTPMLVESVEGELLDLVPVRGENFDALLPLLPGVVRGPKGRLSVKGGQATQTSLRVNSVNVSDPVTGEFGTTLPDDAIDTVTLLPNPYAPEYGGFSAGVSEVETRRGTDMWRWAVSNVFPPGLRFRDSTLRGIGKYRPRLTVSGPLKEGRIHLAQSLHYRIVKTKVPVRPEVENDNRLESFDSFTQIDADVGERHHLQGTLSVFPRNIGRINVDTFNPREVAPNLRQRGFNVAFSDRVILHPTAFIETNVAFKQLDMEIYGEGTRPMVLQPDENSGSFFNDQHRSTGTFQVTEAVIVQRQNWAGDHVFKVGVDFLYASFDGVSLSRPVEVRRADGTLSQRIVYGGETAQDVDSTDIGIFAQDRWRLNDRLLFELGARIDRNGVLEGLNVAPRAGVVLSVRPDGSGVLRGGAGLFFPETTLNVKAFESYETPTVTWFARDGVSEQASIGYIHRLTAEKTPSSLIWNVEYFHRFSDTFFGNVNFLRRTGDNELILNPTESGNGGVLRLDDAGRSRYWELELTSRLLAGNHEMNFSYVRSRSQGDLNVFDEFFGNFRNPIIRQNQFSVAESDTRNRFLFRGSFAVQAWIVSPVLEGRQGFPYSLVDEDLDFVGTRNRGGRFPQVWVLDLDVQRPLRIAGYDTWVGVRVYHLFENEFPRDVQANVDAPTFGSFTNQVERSVGLTFRIEL